MTGLESLRKYSIEVSLRDHLDQLNDQLRQLHDNSAIHHAKRKKLLLQFERRNNQLRRSIERTDQDKQKILTENANFIRMMERKIIQEEQREQRQRRDEQINDRLWWWSPTKMRVMVGSALVLLLLLSTGISMMLNHGNHPQQL